MCCPPLSSFFFLLPFLLPSCFFFYSSSFFLLLFLFLLLVLLLPSSFFLLLFLLIILFLFLLSSPLSSFSLTSSYSCESYWKWSIFAHLVITNTETEAKNVTSLIFPFVPHIMLFNCTVDCYDYKAPTVYERDMSTEQRQQETGTRGEQPVPTTLSTTNPTQMGLGPNRGLRSDRDT